MNRILLVVGSIVAMSNSAVASGILKTTNPRPANANKCAGIHSVPNGFMKFHEFTFANGIVVRNLIPTNLIKIEDNGIHLPSTGTRVDLTESANLVWLKFHQKSAGDVYISAFIDQTYTEIAPGGVDGKTYLITGETIKGFSVRSEFNESRLIEICYIPSV